MRFGTQGAFPPVLKNFRRAFSPGPTDCSWVSEDDKESKHRYGFCLASSAGNSGYSDREESEAEKRRKMLWSCLPKIEECGPRPSSLWTSYWTRACKSSPLRKFFVILTFRHGDKRTRCKYCNLAFMHCLFKIFALFVIPSSMFVV